MRARPIRVRWEGRDGHQLLGVLAGLGLAAGAALGIFGLPPVPLHGPLRYAGMVGPFCGGTRGVQALLSGDFATAWRYNPVAYVVVPGAAAVLIRQAIGMATGRWLNISVTRPRRTLAIVGILVALLWINQARHASLLLEGEHQPVHTLLGTATLTTVIAAAAFIHATLLKRRIQRTLNQSP